MLVARNKNFSKNISFIVLLGNFLKCENAKSKETSMCRPKVTFLLHICILGLCMFHFGSFSKKVLHIWPKNKCFTDLKMERFCIFVCVSANHMCNLLMADG